MSIKTEAVLYSARQLFPLDIFLNT